MKFSTRKNEAPMPIKDSTARLTIFEKTAILYILCWVLIKDKKRQ